MRLLHIDGGRAWGGGQNQVRLLMRGLARLGAEQLCICPAGSPLEKRLLTERLPVRVITWKTGNDPRAIAAIARNVRQWDVIHAHDAHALQLAMMPARLAGVSLVATRRVPEPAQPMKWNLATRVIAISQTVRRSLLNCGVHEQRIRVVFSGVDVDEILTLVPDTPTLRERIGVARGDFLAGNIARLVSFKQQTLIPAAAARANGINWVIVGEGPQRQAIEQSIAQHRVNGRVHLAGALADARRCLSELDAFVFTSLGEALGTSILDAMARGVPVIAPDHSGPGEILRPVHEATAASLYAPGDAAALAYAVSRVRDEPALRAAMIERQRERLRDFVIQKTVDGNVAVYREVMRTTRSA